MSLHELIDWVGAEAVAQLIYPSRRRNRNAEPDALATPATEPNVHEFDEDLAAYLSNHRDALTANVTVGDLARDRTVDRQKYYRLLKRAGSKEKPLAYIRRRLPEIRERLV